MADGQLQTTNMKNNIRNGWLTEWLTPHESHSHELCKIIVKKKTGFQDALIADTFSFGRCLVLDGEMQSAQLDEYIYHEALVHPALCTHPDPKIIAIMGGGEGATAREILRHKTVKKAYMVDIDGEVVDFCKKHMKPWHQGNMDDPRLEVIIGDAKKFIEETPFKFDVIISDLPTPDGGGPAYKLYTGGFYETLKKRLNPGGILVLQAGSGSLIQLDFHLKLYGTLKKVFPLIRSYSAHIPSFDVPWAFLLCAQSRKLDPLSVSAQEIDARVSRRVGSPLSFYDGLTHEGLFRIPKNLRNYLAKGTVKTGIK